MVRTRISMNYQRIHDLIIERARNRFFESAIYLEKHHVIPKCEGGSHEGETVSLTHKEHRVVHLLRWKITGNPKHKFAYNMMLKGVDARRDNARLAASLVKKRGGIGSKEWIANNPEKVFKNASKGGKIGGKVTGSKFWWSNGELNVRSSECPGNGWVRSMLMSDKKEKQVKNFLQKHNKSRTLIIKTPDGIFTYKKACEFYNLPKYKIESRVKSKKQNWCEWMIVGKGDYND